MTGTGTKTTLGVAPAPTSADVGIVAALGVEVGFLTDRLTRVRKYSGPDHRVIEGESGDKLVALIIGGAGRTAARRATELLLDGHRPRWIVSIGFAGALDPSFGRGDIVLPSDVVDAEGRRYSIGVAVPDEPNEAKGPRLRSGRLLTIDMIARTAVEKAALRERYGADVVDMETSAVAGVCSERGVRFLSIRVISDVAGEDLPKEVIALMAKSGSNLVGSALRAIWKRPSALKDFWALHDHAQAAADCLADATLAAIARLPG
jgi:adenosylhomocysteine nucleosidase